MARIHNGRKGKSGSKKPHNQELPEWSLKDAKEIKSLVLELSLFNKRSAKSFIGIN